MTNIPPPKSRMSCHVQFEDDVLQCPRCRQPPVEDESKCVDVLEFFHYLSEKVQITLQHSGVTRLFQIQTKFENFVLQPVH